MRKSTKGFYTLEAVIFLPLVLLTVLAIGYFMRVEGAWENCISGAIDESRSISMKSYDRIHPAALRSKIKERLEADEKNPDNAQAVYMMTDYSDGRNNHLTSYTLEASVHMGLPAGFSRDFEFSTRIKFRGFTGREKLGEPLGSEGLEQQEPENPVWIFPYSGEKYHSETCTYVKASVTRKILTSALKEKYRSCAACGSADMKAGETVFCFAGEDTAYHRGTCRTIDRQTIVIDRSEAQEKKLTPCSKCGGS